jgi:N-acetylglucosamine-6-phosphate deacetylase
MAMQTDLLISGLTVHAAQGAMPTASVSIQNRIIGEIFPDAAPRFSGRRLEFPASYHLVPGRIDMHIHGAHGADVMDATPAALDQIRQSLAAEGVTGFLATTVTESVEKINFALQNIDDYQKNISKAVAGAEILGIHLEGPFISPRHAGAHRVELILAPDPNLFDRWQAYAGGRIKSVTVAPELTGGIEFIQHLHRHGVIAAIGHTDADFDITGQAVIAGARHATHLFNAMRGFHHREPGCVGAILLNPYVLAELIADGHHCHPAALDLAFRLKSRDGLVLVTDAMRAKCCGSTGPFDLGGQSVMVQEGAARLKNGVLAGSVLTMTQAVKNMLRFTAATLDDLIYLTSINPARALGIDEKKGTISPGKDADLAVLDHNLEVVLTVSNGRIIFQRENHVNKIA